MTSHRRRIEEKYKMSFEQLLPRMYNEMGLPRMAKELGVSRSTVWYWLLSYGVRLQRVAFSRDEILVIRKVRKRSRKTS